MYLLTAPCFVLAQTEGKQVIGTFTGTLDADPIELQSIYVPEEEYSDLTVSDASGVKTYHINASMNQGLPIIDLTLQEGGVIGALKITSITFFDIDYDTALAATELTAGGIVFESYGKLEVNSLTLGSDGEISFSFSADLIRIDVDNETAIANQPGGHLEGHYSGIIPASELRK